MNTLKRFFEKIKAARYSRLCSCGHAVSANLPCCPHCGRRLVGNDFDNNMYN